jgi:hypothetical protein
MPFREAYKRAAAEYSDQDLPDPESARRQRRSTGTPGQLKLDVPLDRLREQTRRWNEQRARHGRAVRDLLGDTDRVRPFSEEPHR